jgi:hypothetical protein
MGMSSRMDSGTFVQHPIDRCPAQTGRRDNFTYANASLNVHIATGAAARHRNARPIAIRGPIDPFNPIKKIMYAFRL